MVEEQTYEWDGEIHFEVCPWNWDRKVCRRLIWIEESLLRFNFVSSSNRFCFDISFKIDGVDGWLCSRAVQIAETFEKTRKSQINFFLPRHSNPKEIKRFWSSRIHVDVDQYMIIPSSDSTQINSGQGEGQRMRFLHEQEDFERFTAITSFQFQFPENGR